MTGGIGTAVHAAPGNEAVDSKTAPLTHAGLSRWLYRVSGSTPEHDAAAATDFGAAFGL